MLWQFRKHNIQSIRKTIFKTENVEVVFKTKTGQTTPETVVFKPANDSLEKFIPRTKLLGEDKFEIPVHRDNQEENCNESNLAFTCNVVSSQRPYARLFLNKGNKNMFILISQNKRLKKEDIIL